MQIKNSPNGEIGSFQGGVGARLWPSTLSCGVDDRTNAVTVGLVRPGGDCSHAVTECNAHYPLAAYYSDLNAVIRGWGRQAPTAHRVTPATRAPFISGTKSALASSRMCLAPGVIS